MSSHEEKRRKWWLKQLKRKSKQQSPEPVELPQEEEEDDESCADKELTGKKRRYILFVGNLSYSTTADEIQEQFMKRGVPIQQVRLLTHKDTNKSRGCCFLEFTQAKHQQNALKFDKMRIGGRAINIQVTCGGGGNSQRRRDKIKRRNDKLTHSKINYMS